MMNFHVKETIAVLGAASRFTDVQVIAGFRIGRAIAKRGYNLVTGATLGVPYAASIGAKLEGAVVVGLSPAATREEHIGRYKRPLDYADVVIYTGMGLEGRQPINIRSAKGAVFVGGEFGTLAEFSAAWTVGNNVLGILEGVGGVSDYLREIIGRVQSEYGSLVIYDSDPDHLVKRVCDELEERGGLIDHATAAISNGIAVRKVIERYLDGTGGNLEAQSGTM